MKLSEKLADFGPHPNEDEWQKVLKSVEKMEVDNKNMEDALVRMALKECKASGEERAIKAIESIAASLNRLAMNN